jgi:formamidopyrimidine-DNA glycosylase
MSIELPEAHILATQMNRELVGKQLAAVEVKNYENLQKIGCVNRNLADYAQLVGSRIEAVHSRGLVILVKFDNGKSLLLAPEYGGRILYHTEGSAVPEKFHLNLQFSDKTSLTVTLTGLGGIQAFNDSDLDKSYVYRRDFSNVPSPDNPAEFLFAQFAERLAAKNVNIKSVLVGREALVVGLSNSAFQDILFRAKLHPKRKAAKLTDQEKQALFDAVNRLVSERIAQMGKNLFVDLYGRQGSYEPRMGQNMKGQGCKACGTSVEVLSLGGGQVYFCPKCQA